jgi:LmbE family N-acetylglucosaminyl deacetylase
VNVLLSPHNDDETLFAAYTIMQHDCHVVVCLRSAVELERGGPSYHEREAETTLAIGRLGPFTWEQWTVLDNTPERYESIMEADLRNEMLKLQKRLDPERVFAPAIEAGGHWQHNLVGDLATEVFGPERVAYYLTYVRGEGRSKGVEVVPTPRQIERKLYALSAYRSQIELDYTRPWFVDDPMREWRPE